MVDLFKIGFVVVSIVLVTALGLVVAMVDFDSDRSVVDYISALGSLVGGVAGLTAAVAAYFGVDAWKRQIMYGRYLAAIWDAKVHLRMIQRALTDCSILQAFMAYNGHTQNAEMKAKLETSKKKLEEFEASFASSCAVLDKVVTKNDWEWQNYASELSAYSTNLLRDIVQEPAGLVDFNEFFEARIKDQEIFQDLLKRLDDRLDVLEGKYS